MLYFLVCLAVYLLEETIAAQVEAQQSLRLALGSCHDIRRVLKSEDGDIWDRIRERKPNAFIWGGDNIYGDYEPTGLELLKKIVTDFEHVRHQFPPFYANPPEYLQEMYQKTANLPQYKEFVQYLGPDNIIGIWDDHDYGFNDAGQLQYAWRDESQQAFLDFFKVPENHPRRALKGIYSSAEFLEGRVKVIMLDNRYHRDSYDNASGDFLGEEQWDWLKQELANEDGKVEVALLVSGIQVLSTSRLLQDFAETWLKFPKSKERLLRTISESETPNIILVSGDVHFGEQSVVKCSGNDGKLKFILPELTTSGMTHSWSTYPVAAHVFMQIMQFVTVSPSRYENKYTLKKNFGEIDFFLDGNEEERYVVLRVFNYEGVLAFESKFMLSQLKNKVEDAVECVSYHEPTFLEAEARYALAHCLAVVMPLCGFMYVLSKCFKGTKRVLRWKKKEKNQ